MIRHPSLHRGRDPERQRRLWLSSFWGKALVRRVMLMRMVRLERSKKFVEGCSGSGLPVIVCSRELVHMAGL